MTINLFANVINWDAVEANLDTVAKVFGVDEFALEQDESDYAEIYGEDR